MSKHLIVVSVDALTFEDLEFAKTLPFFGKLLNGGAVIQKVKSIYPSFTHPAHATLITGRTAGKTGIVNNRVFNPASPDAPGVYYNYLDEIKCDTLIHSAKRNGLTVATSSWPMTSGGSEYIDYLVPNAMNSDFIGYEDDPLQVYRRLGSKECVMDIIEKAVSLYGYQNRHPEMDDLQTYCCCEIIKRFKPNLLLTHPGFVDDERHRYGVFNDKIEASLVRTDAWLGAIYEAVKEAGIEAETDFIVLGDHGQINITRTVHINSYLKRAGFIQTDEKGKILSWDAYAYSVGASAQVYLSNKNEELYSAVYSLLSSMANEGVYGFEKVYCEQEVREKYGLYGDFSFVLETDGYTAFGDAIKEPPIVSVPLENCRYGRGTHGYEPEKGPQTTLLAIGPSIKKGAVVEKGELINHAPTFAKILGIDFACDGKPETRILK